MRHIHAAQHDQNMTVSFAVQSRLVQPKTLSSSFATSIATMLPKKMVKAVECEEIC